MGGVGVRLPFGFINRCRAFRENIPLVQVRTFLFLTVAVRSGKVFDLAVSIASLGVKADTADIGSERSFFGLGLGGLSFEWLNQNFFFIGGLPEVVHAGDAEAERGLFGRLTELICADASVNVKPAASAV